MPAFSFNKSKKDGLQSYCKVCASIKYKEYYLANKEKIDALNKVWREENVEIKRAADRVYCFKNKIQIKQKKKLRHTENKEKSAIYRLENSREIKKRKAAYRVANIEKVKAAIKKWRVANKGSGRVHDQTRRARKLGAGGTHTAKDIEQILTLQKHTCPICNVNLKIGYQIDHVIPFALGGTNAKENLQLLCKKCNQQKHATHPIDFMQSKGFLL